MKKKKRKRKKKKKPELHGNSLSYTKIKDLPKSQFCALPSETLITFYY